MVRADGRNLCFITTTIADEAGRLVPCADKEIAFEVNGPGKIIATDNGDATSHVSFQSPKRHAFNGLALVVVRTRSGMAGDIVLQATCEGLQSAATTLSSR